MKLIIDIPEDVYKKTVFYREFKDLNDCVTTIKALEKATPLDKISAEINDEAVKTRNADKRDGLYIAREIVDRYR